MNPPDYPFHPVSELFPLLTGKAFEDFKANVAEVGQQEPVWLFRGAIIDGRNRYRACRDLGKPVLTREFEGAEAELVSFVVSLNLHRRHLDESQRAMVAARLAKLKRGGNQQKHREEQSRNSDIALPQAAAAAALNVSRDSVIQARRVQTQGTPELAKEVDAGRVSVSAAATVAELPKPEQKAVVAAGPTAIVRRAAEIREEKRAERVAVKPAAPPPTPAEKPARQWSVVGDDAFSSPLRKLLDEVRLSGGIVKYAGFMTPPQKASAVKRLRALISDIESWIEALEADHV